MFHSRVFLFLLIASLCVEPLPAHALRPQPDRSGVEERLSAAGMEELGKEVQAARTEFLLNQKKDILEASRAYGHAVGRAIQEESERLGNTGGSTVFVMGSFSNGIAVHSEREPPPAIWKLLWLLRKRAAIGCYRTIYGTLCAARDGRSIRSLSPGP